MIKQHKNIFWPMKRKLRLTYYSHKAIDEGRTFEEIGRLNLENERNQENKI